MPNKNKLQIRKNGNYYQIGFNHNKRWHHIYQIGTPENLLEKLGVPIPEEYQKLMSEFNPKKSKGVPNNQGNPK